MVRKNALAVVMILLALAYPVYAVDPSLLVQTSNLLANTTVNGLAYVNINTTTTFLNLSFNVTAGTPTDVNITAVNITINGSATMGNISGIILKNATGAVIGSNTTNASANSFTINIPNGFFVNASTGNGTYILLAVNVSVNATKFKNLSIFVNVTADIGTNSSTTVSLSGNPSALAQFQDLRAAAVISPRLVDTNVTNQTLVYTITPLGTDAIQNVSITVPTGYSLKTLLSVSDGGNVLGANVFDNTTTGNIVNISLHSETTSVLVISFSVNTNTTSKNALAFTSTIDGTQNMSFVPTVVNSTGINVTTQTILNITTVSMTKSTAIINGSDYWEFKFTVNSTANISNGIFQFRMENWSDGSGHSINLVSANNSVFYASFYDNLNASRNQTVLNAYNQSAGFLPTSCCTSTQSYDVILRMIIPLGSAVSSNWFTTYNLLFRATA